MRTILTVIATTALLQAACGQVYYASHDNMVDLYNGATWDNTFTVAKNDSGTAVVTSMSAHEDGCLLIVGGDFHSVDGEYVNHIFMTRDGSTIQNMEGGVNGPVTYVEQLDRRTFLVGGNFTQAGNQMVGGFATATIGEDDYVSWSMYGSGVQGGQVYDVRPMGNNWLIVGDFTSVGGNLLYTQRVAEFNTVDQVFRALGVGSVTEYPVGDGIVKAGAALGGDYYIGGDFTEVDGNPVNGLAKTGTGADFVQLGGGGGTDVRGMAEDADNVFMVGNMVDIATTCGVAAYNPTDGLTEYAGCSPWGNGDVNGIHRNDDGTMFLFGDLGAVAVVSYNGTGFEEGTDLAGAAFVVSSFATTGTEIGTESYDGACNFGQGPGPGAASMFGPSAALSLLVVAVVGFLSAL